MAHILNREAPIACLSIVGGFPAGGNSGNSFKPSDFVQFRQVDRKELSVYALVLKEFSVYDVPLSAIIRHHNVVTLTKPLVLKDKIHRGQSKTITSKSPQLDPKSPLT